MHEAVVAASEAEKQLADAAVAKAEAENAATAARVAIVNASSAVQASAAALEALEPQTSFTQSKSAMSALFRAAGGDASPAVIEQLMQAADAAVKRAAMAIAPK